MRVVMGGDRSVSSDLARDTLTVERALMELGHTTAYIAGDPVSPVVRVYNVLRLPELYRYCDAMGMYVTLKYLGRARLAGNQESAAQDPKGCRN